MMHFLRPSTVSALLFASIIPLLPSSPGLALQVQDLQGRTYYQDPTTRGMNINRPNTFIGLPENARDQGGWLLDIPDNDVFAPNFLGVSMFEIGQQSFLLFDVISNFEDGRTYNRVLDAIEIPDNVMLLKCLNSPEPAAEAIALLTPAETAIVNAQGPNMMDGVVAEIASPQQLYLIHSRHLKIEPIPGQNFTCTGFPWR